jgi:hypothetical protein
MKPLTLIATLPLLCLLSFYPPEKKFSAPKEMSQCEAVKLIAEAFKKAEYDKVKDEADEENTDEYSSRITMKGYKDQMVYDASDEIYFEAKYDKAANSAEAINAQLKKLAGEIEKCLALKPEYLVTTEYIFYTFEYAENVEIELSANHPGRADRYINIEISRQK